MVEYGTRLSLSKIEVVVRGPRGVKAAKKAVNPNKDGRPAFTSFCERIVAIAALAAT